MPSNHPPATPLAPLILIFTLFFLWGVANNLNDVLIPHLRKAFFLNDFQSSLVQSAFYLGYFFLALPAGWTIHFKGGWQPILLDGRRTACNHGRVRRLRRMGSARALGIITWPCSARVARGVHATTAGDG